MQTFLSDIKYFVDLDLINFLLFFGFTAFLFLSLIALIIVCFLTYKKQSFKYLVKFFICDFFLFLVFIGIFYALLYLNNSPTDSELKQNFTINQVEFNKLKDQIQSDGKKGLRDVWESSTDPYETNGIGVSEQDILNYKKRMKAIKIEAWHYLNSDQIEFSSYASGGYYTGYVFTPLKLDNYYNDGCYVTLKENGSIATYKGFCTKYTVYKQIDNNWYIYREYIR